MQDEFSLCIKEVYQVTLVAEHSPTSSRRHYWSTRLSNASQCGPQNNRVLFHAELLQKHDWLDVKWDNVRDPLLIMLEFSCYVPNEFVSGSSEMILYDFCMIVFRGLNDATHWFNVLVYVMRKVCFVLRRFVRNIIHRLYFIASLIPLQSLEKLSGLTFIFNFITLLLEHLRQFFIVEPVVLLFYFLQNFSNVIYSSATFKIKPKWNIFLDVGSGFLRVFVLNTKLVCFVHHR